MPMTHGRATTTLWMALVAVALTLSCSGGPSGPQQGTPEWYLDAATDNYAMSDFTKTVEQLGEATKDTGEVGARAVMWHAVLTAGLARGYEELKATFEEGMEANDARTGEFQNLIDDFKRRTRINAIEFSENVGKVQSLIEGQETVTLNLPLPSGNGSASPILESVRAGNQVPPQLTAMVEQTLTRGIYSVISTLTGGTDFAKLASDAQGAGIQTTTDQFSFGIGRILLDIAVMFDREGINEPRVRTHILELAEKWAMPYFEDEAFADRVEEFQFDLTNEKRDMEGKRRIKKD